MRESMADIQSVTAEIRRGKKKNYTVSQKTSHLWLAILTHVNGF